MRQQPLGIYINWSTYDELSDAVPLTEDIAMRQFDHFLRLRRLGVKLDCYLMDCFWYDPDGAYRTWRRPHWRDDGERWLAACKEHGVMPGLWFGCNAIGKWLGVNHHPRWAGSLESAKSPSDSGSACLFEGPFLPDLMEVFHMWYERGVRVFKLDFLNQDASLPHHRRHLHAQEIRTANAQAFRVALARFRDEHPEVVFIAYNGYDDGTAQAGTDYLPRRNMDRRWLDALDSFYTGDPRPSDVPAWHFWRSKDVYSDHQVRNFLEQGFDRRVLDNAGFMVGTTATCYHRGAEAWKGMLILSLVRGGLMNTYYGNLDLLSDRDAAWFAKAQELFWPLLENGQMTTLGALPGSGGAYGFRLSDARGTLTAVVNPGQLPVRLALPDVGTGRLLFRDAGFVPQLAADGIVLGAEQMALIGTGVYAAEACDLGVQDDVPIPLRSEALTLVCRAEGHNALVGTLTAPSAGRVRLVLRQTGPDGRAKRTSGGLAPHGTTLGKLLTLSAEQDGKPLVVEIRYDKAIWSGLSWAVGEIAIGSQLAGKPINVRVASSEQVTMTLTVEAYAVT